MKRIRLGWSAPVLALLLASPTYAATLVTPAITKSAFDRLECRIANEGAQPIKVTIETLDDDGDVIGRQTLTGPPGGVLEGPITVGFVNAIRCRFSGAFSKRSVRASMDVASGDRTIVVVPAQ